MHERCIDCKFMLHYDYKLNSGDKLDAIPCFALFYRVNDI